MHNVSFGEILHLCTVNFLPWSFHFVTGFDILVGFSILSSNEFIRCFHEFIPVEKENKLLVAQKPFFFLRLPVEKEAMINIR